MHLFLEQVLNGIGRGVIYSLVAVALVLIFRTTGVLNFATGEMALFSTFITWKLATSSNVPIVGAILISMTIAFIAGAAIERTLIRPVETGRSPLNVVIVTLGLFLALAPIAQLLWGVEPVTMPTIFPSGSVEILHDSSIIPPVRKEVIGLLAVLLVECLVLWALLQKTKLGLKLRAVANDPESARLHGIRAGTMLMVGWAMAAALGALAGAFVAADQTFFDVSLMQIVLVYALAAAALGGFDSLWGAVICGMIVGVADSLTTQYVAPLDGIEVVMPLALILIVLVVSPHGLFGKRTVERV
jgi:branched-chain amino acid transport system permease protein